MTQSVLVIGGTGMLGELVARRLHGDGHHVRVFSRYPEKAQARFGAPTTTLEARCTRQVGRK